MYPCKKESFSFQYSSFDKFVENVKNVEKIRDSTFVKIETS